MKNETDETKAMAKVARKRDAFEATWTRYVNALEQYEYAKENLEATRYTRRPGHWLRVARGARREAERAHAVLTTRFDMNLGGVL
jgi:hypothetical protein